MIMTMKSHLLIVSFLIAVSAQAQSLYNETVISITPSAVLFVKDSLVNNGTIINNGDMQVGGSWINNMQYDAGQGQITFNSDLPQVINHNDQAFSKLTISGGGEKLFLANITIENELDLSDGTLVSQNDARIIFSPGAQIIGGSDRAHINGPAYHRGAGAHLFPVGNGEEYLPVTLLNVEGGNAEVGVREVELQGIALQPSPSLKAVSANRYWQLDVVSGDISQSQVILPVRDESIVTDANEAVVSQAQSLSANFENLGQFQFDGSVSNGMVTSNKFVTMPFLAVATASDDRQLVVYNAVSPNGDGLNDFLRILNIEYFPENKFSLFNRWGDLVFEIENYDNAERVFRGRSSVNGEKELGNGTYFYVIETKDGRKVNGFLVLKN